MNPRNLFCRGLLLTLTALLIGCGDRYERIVPEDQREEGKRYLDSNEVHRCYIVVSSDPDGCDLAGVTRDKHTELGRTPLRIAVDVRDKEYTDGTHDIRIDRVNESRSTGEIFKQTGVYIGWPDWRELELAYLFEKEGFISERFEDTTVTAEEFLALPDRTYRIHVRLQPETLALKPAPAPELETSRPDYECDVRLVEVSSGRAVRATTGQANDSAGFRNMADRVVYELTGNLDVPERAKVAVLDLEEIGEKTVEGQYGKLVARMLSTSLIHTGNFEVIERQQLDTLLKERDLTDAQVAASPGTAGKVLGLDYVILGSVAKVR